VEPFPLAKYQKAMLLQQLQAATNIIARGAAHAPIGIMTEEG